MKNSHEVAYVALGSNLGDREAVFLRVICEIEASASISLLEASPIYETDPMGPDGQGPYLNAVLRLETEFSPLELLEWLLALELSLGRDRSVDAVRWGPRMIDIDILFFGDRCIENGRLIVPHPRAHERAFVLIPMASLDAEHVHPVLGQTIKTIAGGLVERESVREWRSPPGWPGRD